MCTDKTESLPFSYFLGNKNIIYDLKLELVRLKGRRYTCSDEALPYVEQEIEKIEKCIKFNQMFTNS